MLSNLYRIISNETLLCMILLRPNKKKTKRTPESRMNSNHYKKGEAENKRFGIPAIEEFVFGRFLLRKVRRPQISVLNRLFARWNAGRD